MNAKQTEETGRIKLAMGQEVGVRQNVLFTAKGHWGLQAPVQDWQQVISFKVSALTFSCHQSQMRSVGGMEILLPTVQ